ncbi:MAG: hypothetical protein KDD51_10625, partial [Bdellovibrionales bacterium]|nr:hypothetical protein [Bdellovibrionales bacterium]
MRSLLTILTFAACWSLQSLSHTCAVELVSQARVMGHAEIATDFAAEGVATVVSWPGHVLFLQDGSERIARRFFPDLKFSLFESRTHLRSLSTLSLATHLGSAAGYYAGVDADRKIFLAHNHSTKRLDLPSLEGVTAVSLFHTETGAGLVAATADGLFLLSLEHPKTESWQKVPARVGFAVDFIRPLVLGEERAFVLGAETGEVAIAMESQALVALPKQTWIRDIQAMGADFLLLTGRNEILQCRSTGPCLPLSFTLPPGVLPVQFAAASIKNTRQINERWNGGYLSREHDGRHERVLILGSDGKLYSLWELSKERTGSGTIPAYAQVQTAMAEPDATLAEQAFQNMLTTRLPETPSETRFSFEKLAALPHSTVEKNALLASYFRRLRHKSFLELAPEISEQVGLTRDETIVLLELLPQDARRDLIRLEKLEPGEISHGPVQRTLELLRRPAVDSRAPLSAESFGIWHAQFG